MNYLSHYLHNFCAIVGISSFVYFGCSGLLRQDDNPGNQSTVIGTTESQNQNEEESVSTESTSNYEDDMSREDSIEGEEEIFSEQKTVSLTIVDEYDRVFNDDAYVGNLIINRTDYSCKGIALISGDTISIDEIINRTDFVDENNLITRPDIIGTELFVAQNIFEEKMENWALYNDVATNGSVDASLSLTYTTDTEGAYGKYRTRNAYSFNREENGNREERERKVYCVYTTMALDGGFVDAEARVEASRINDSNYGCTLHLTIHSIYDAHIALALFTDPGDSTGSLYGNGYLSQIMFGENKDAKSLWYTITEKEVRFDSLVSIDKETLLTGTSSNLGSLESVGTFTEFYDQDDDGVSDVFQKKSFSTPLQ